MPRVPDRFEEIGGRIAAKEREQTLAITAEVEKQFLIEKVRVETKAKADLELEGSRVPPARRGPEGC